MSLISSSIVSVLCRRHSSRPAGRSTDIRIECSAAVCPCCLSRGRGGQQFNTLRCIFMARIASRLGGNRRVKFVSHWHESSSAIAPKSKSSKWDVTDCIMIQVAAGWRRRRGTDDIDGVVTWSRLPVHCCLSHDTSPSRLTSALRGHWQGGHVVAACPTVQAGWMRQARAPGPHAS